MKKINAYKCEICGMTTLNKEDMRKHEKTCKRVTLRSIEIDYGPNGWNVHKKECFLIGDSNNLPAILVSVTQRNISTTNITMVSAHAIIKYNAVETTFQQALDALIDYTSPILTKRLDDNYGNSFKEFAASIKEDKQ